MKIEYRNANNLLAHEFPEMKTAFDGNEDGYDDTPHYFYSCEFVPYTLKHLEQNNGSELKKIFGFVEKFFTEGDELTVNLVDVSFVESLYYDRVHENHKASLLKHCGERTLKSFVDCFNDEEKAEWEKSLAT